MRRLIRYASGWVYRHIAKPILFLLHPDGVHRRLMRLAKAVQRVPGVRVLPGLWAYRSRMLETNAFGLHFENPIGLSAGFDKNIEIAPLIKRIGFGFMTGGSVTAEACDGNPKPWYHRLPYTKSLVVHAGLPNVGVEVVMDRLAQYPKNVFTSMPLVVSVAKTNSRSAATDQQAIDDYCTSLAMLEKQARQQLFEINISCPNAYGGEAFTTPERLERLLTAVDGLRLSTPVTIKMPINKSWSEFRELLEVIVRHQVDGVSIGNLQHDRTQIDPRDRLPDSVKGNLSGAPTREASTHLIRETYRHYGNQLTIIGIGGVFTAEDAYVKLRAGASLVALITGMIFEGPQRVGEINEGLVRLLEVDGFGSVAEAIGVDAK